MQLNNRALEFIDAFSAGLAEHYSVSNPSRAFKLTDPQETTLRAALLESVEFLSWITVADVDQLSAMTVLIPCP
ncbi:P2 family phage major capsid protein [Kosakonia sacchari]|uniref:P2 family phage major capsid protein n=1 Tax=Kosakonia sacchari TaxID=1158459 RepID=UPI001364834C|nr:P2 family phage major capsid protein [Kosakonia sacchari]